MASARRAERLRIATVSTLAAWMLCAGAARATVSGPPQGIADAAGHLHPFIVHFPVALILAALVAEAICVVRRDGRFADAARFMVAAAAWTSLLAALTGFLRADALTFDAVQRALFSVHRIAGIATPVLAFLAAGLAEGTRRSGQIWELYLYRAVLLAAGVAAAVAGHYGGELVFGAGFFPLW